MRAPDARRRMKMNRATRRTGLRVAVLVASALPILLGADSVAAGGVSPTLPAVYALVVTGGELLDGSISDAHTPFITRSLKPLGLRCARSILVGDGAEDLRSALTDAAAQADLVLTTGGLGPTVNDRTREALAAFTGIELRENPDILAILSRRFGQPPEALRENLRRQALAPVRGGYLPNDAGTAVGLVYTTPERTFIALPGPPRELQPMVTKQLVPWLRERLGLTGHSVSLTLRFYGIGQSAIDSVMRQQLTLPPDLTTASEFAGGRVDFTFSLPQDSPEARTQLAGLALGFREHLGRHLYATNSSTLEAAAWARLATEGSSLLIAEVGGPHLASALTRASLPPSARIASVAAPTEEALAAFLGIASDAWATASTPAARIAIIGKAAQERFDTDWTLVLGTFNPVDARHGTVWTRLGSPLGEWRTRKFTTRESPEIGWPSFLDRVLDWLRTLDR